LTSFLEAAASAEAVAEEAGKSQFTGFIFVADSHIIIIITSHRVLQLPLMMLWSTDLHMQK